MPTLELLNRAIADHYEEIRGAVARHGHPGSAAGDIVHDLYLKLADRPAALAGVRSLRDFLIRAALNLGLDRHRRSNFEQRLFSGSEAEAGAVPSDAPAPDQALDLSARLKVLRQAIADLPERRRLVFVLHCLHRLGPDEIAGRLRISRNMVDRHLRRASVHCLERLSELD